LSAFVSSALPQSPSLLITDARHIGNVNSPTVKDTPSVGGGESVRKSERDTAFLDRVIQTLRRGGNVLIPSDTSGTSLSLSHIFSRFLFIFVSFLTHTGRVLEILLVLEQHWAANRLGCYGIAMLSKTSYNSCRFASSQLEWMNEHVVKVINGSL